jgi:hypothetical protein
VQGSDSIRIGNRDGSVPVPPNRVPVLLHRDWVYAMDQVKSRPKRTQHVYVVSQLAIIGELPHRCELGDDQLSRSVRACSVISNGWYKSYESLYGPAPLDPSA